MSRAMNPTIFRIVGIAMIVIAIFNVVPSLALFGTGVPGPNADNNAVGVEDESVTEDAIESTGGITTITGPATLVLAPLMIAIGVALLLLKCWEMFAAIVLILDALLKGANLLANIAVPDANAALYLTPLIVIVIDVALAYLILQQRSARRDDSAATRVS